ncbi:hypothetical protein QUF90_03745 [Desulfococcaceae bacterium HSG9]|nr:hypothetical protein [Desulfococcaceae bacterium HSG9]
MKSKKSNLLNIWIFIINIILLSLPLSIKVQAADIKAPSQDSIYTLTVRNNGIEDLA